MSLRHHVCMSRVTGLAVIPTSMNRGYKRAGPTLIRHREESQGGGGYRTFSRVCNRTGWVLGGVFEWFISLHDIELP